MKRYFYKTGVFVIILTFFSFFGIMSCTTQPHKDEHETTEYKIPDNNEHLEWFREAKFGMFIHWGPYSRLAGEWNGRVQTENNGEWVMKYLRIPVKEYRNLAHEFNPVKFNAQE
jgi:alpha-L-fucosidase